MAEPISEPSWDTTSYFISNHPTLNPSCDSDWHTAEMMKQCGSQVLGIVGIPRSFLWRCDEQQLSSGKPENGRSLRAKSDGNVLNPYQKLWNTRDWFEVVGSPAAFSTKNVRKIVMKSVGRKHKKMVKPHRKMRNTFPEMSLRFSGYGFARIAHLSRALINSTAVDWKVTRPCAMPNCAPKVGAKPSQMGWKGPMFTAMPRLVTSVQISDSDVSNRLQQLCTKLACYTWPWTPFRPRYAKAFHSPEKCTRQWNRSPTISIHKHFAWWHITLQKQEQLCNTLFPTY